MNQILVAVDALEINTQESDSFTLRFVEDVEYEFVGGGTATNGY